MKKSFKFIIFFSIFISNYIYNTEHKQETNNKIKPIIIQDLNTSFSPSLGYIKWRINLDSSSYYSSGELFLYKNLSAAPLINFWQQKFDPCISQFCIQFFPTIIRYTSKDKLKNVGTLNSKVHDKAQSACKNGRALYFPYQQGAIIYHSFYKVEKNNYIYKAIMKKKSKICTIIDTNLKTLTTFKSPY